MQGLSTTARNAALLAGLLLTFFVLISYQANRATTVSSARARACAVQMLSAPPARQVIGPIVLTHRASAGGSRPCGRATSP